MVSEESDEGGGDDADRDVATTAGELAAELEALREELRRERRGPFGLPAPPRPGELLRFADERAIPFAVAVLEANIRALELLQGAIRLVESGRNAGTEAAAARERARSVSRASLERLDDVLADLEAVVTSSETPPDETAADIVTEARRLREELADALSDARDGGEPETSGGGEDETTGTAVTDAGDDGDTAPQVDVEGELESIKRELDEMDDQPPHGDGPTTPDGSEPSDDEP